MKLCTTYEHYGSTVRGTVKRILKRFNRIW